MAVYCQDTHITRWLPANHGITSFTSIIAGATALTDTALCARYWPFPDIAATPATPRLVTDLCSFYGAFLAYAQIGATAHLEGDSLAELYQARADQLARRLLADPIEGKIPTEVVAAETMTLLGNDPLDSTEYKFACAPKDIIPESVAIAGFQLGLDFTVKYSGRDRAWLLVVLSTSEITSTSSVSYEYTYLRHREIDRPSGTGSCRVVRA